MKQKQLRRLTEKQRTLFQLIVSLRNRHRYPSLEKLGVILGITRASVNDRMNALLKKEYIDKDESGAPIPTIDGIEQYMKDATLNRIKKGR